VEGALSVVRSRRRLAGLVVAALVGVSILGRILLGLDVPTPWIVPDETIYGILGRTLYHSGRLTVANANSDFYSLVYPALIGGPLAWLSPHRGYEVAKALGAISMSLAAVPAYLWARSVVSNRSAVLVAALTLALPSLAYTGLLMTETVFYPLLVLFCWVSARTLVAPTARSQLLVVGLVTATALTRVQGGVLVLVFPTAVLLAGVGVREAPRRFAITFLGFGIAVAAWLVWRLASGGGAVGAYTVTTSGGYHLIPIVRYVFYHAGALVLLTGFFPACAAALLWFERRRLSAEVRAALAVATALSLWLVLEVGAFASQFVGHVAERDMIAAAPPLFLCLAVWLELGAPRTVRRTLLVSGAAVVAILAWPLHTMLGPAAFPSALGLVPIDRLAGSSVARERLLLDGGFVLAALVLILSPRRVLRVVPYLLIVLLGTGSVVAERYITKQAHISQETMLGPQKDWIDRAAKGPVILVYGDKLQWAAVWESLFWNRKLVAAYALSGAQVIGPAPGGYVALSNSGTVILGGHPLPQRYAVTELGLLAAGTRLADAGVTAGIVAPWRLWRLGPPLTLVGRYIGVQVNGDIYQSATVHAFSCPGSLRLILLAKQDEQISLYRQGQLYRRLNVKLDDQPIKELHVVVPAVPSAQGPCDYVIRTTGLLGTDEIALDPPGGAG
jgi:hypothetical protein